MKNSIKKAVATVSRLPQFQALNTINKKRVIKALEAGRVYLSNNTNGSAEIAGLHYTTKHYGKMTNVISISTSVVDNPICSARRMDRDSICSFCFAAAQMDCYTNMRPVFANNLDILKSRLLEAGEIPVILSKSGLLRGESFGDVCNVIQAANYLRIAAANPWEKFAVWTKNPQFYFAAIQAGYCEKPNNCNIVLSSRYVNKVDDVNEKYKGMIDRVFTVYDNAGINANGVNINCGARSCAKCMKCYKKTTKYFLINEKLK